VKKVVQPSVEGIELSFVGMKLATIPDSSYLYEDNPMLLVTRAWESSHT
jgi:hypothetical protein